MKSRINYLVTRLSIVGLVSIVMLISFRAQAMDYNKDSPNNLLKDIVMTGGLLVKGTPVSKYKETYKYTSAIAVVGGKRYVISQGVDYQGAEYDAKMTFLRDIRMEHDKKNVIYTAPANAAFVKLTFNNNDTGRYFIEEPTLNTAPEEKSKSAQSVSCGEQWLGKKIAWYGTSIPKGYPKQEQHVWSYANRSVNAVGATMQNFSVPNGVIRESKRDGSSLGGRDKLSFAKTISAINYQTSMLSLIGTANEPDLFVFDYGVNDNDVDASDFSEFDPLDPYNKGNLPNKISIASRDKKTYIGAQNWVIDQLLKVKPNARIAFVTHFSKDAYDKTNRWEKLIQIQNALGEYWGFPTCKVYSKTGWINREGNNTIKTYIPDGIHPASSATTQSVDILTVIVSDFLKGIY